MKKLTVKMKDKTETHTGSPDVIAPPPRIYLGGLTIGIILHLIKPISLLPQNLSLPIGVVFILVGVILVVTSFQVLRNANTNIDVREPVMDIVTSGPYRFSRNPIYLAMTILFIGIGILVNSLWILIILVPIIFVMEFGVIAREEKYLARKFGDKYTRYKTQVRKWI